MDPSPTSSSAGVAGSAEPLLVTTTSPPRRTPELDHLARWVRELSALDAALLWLPGNIDQPASWGAHGLLDDGLERFTPPTSGRAAGSATTLVPPAAFGERPIHQQLMAPIGGAEGAEPGLLMAWAFSARPNDDGAAQLIVERLARSLAHQPFGLPLQAAPETAERPRDPLEARLRSAMRAMQMASWVYQVAPRRLRLSPDAAAILSVQEATSQQLDTLLQSFTPETASALRRAFVDCIRHGRPIDTEVQFAGAASTRRWMRFIGEASAGADGRTQEIHGAVQDVSTRRQAQEETVRLAMRLTTTLASIDEAFVTLDRQCCFMYINRRSEQLLGHSAREMLGEPVHRWLTGRTPELLQHQLAEAMARNERVEFEDFYPALDKWLEVRAHPYAEGLAVYFRDVTERRRTQEQLMLLETGIARLNDVVLIIESIDGHIEHARIAFVNDAFERQTGIARQEVLGHDLRVIEQGMGADALKELVAGLRQADTATLRRREMLMRRRDRTTYWMDLDVVPVNTTGDQVTHWVAVGRDVTARKQADEKIHRLAFFDPLTGLPNRQLLIERLQAALQEAERSGQMGALMFIDLDNFKVLNDTMGHSRGDLLLQRVGERLVRSVRKTDTVARIGGDEFVLMLQNLGTDPAAAIAKTHRVATKVLTRMSEPFDLDFYQHYCTVSIGVTSFGARHEDVSELLKQADLAMYHAKSLGRDTIAFFDPALQATVTANAALGTELRSALQAGQQFVVYYQPLCDRQRRVRGVEALLRWQHPVRGAISPAEFIPIAEETGLILPLGGWVLEQACAQLAAWALRPETAEISISVNVSVRQFRHPEFVDRVIAAISRHRVRPHLLKLELTESLLAERMEITLEKMDTLRNLGVTLSLDDFGTGYSSLAYLKRLPLDQLKIDKGFVADVLTDPSDAAIARAIIELAHSLDLKVIAEGVETAEQHDFLAAHGCDLFQGFLLARPMPLAALEDFMQAQRDATAQDLQENRL